MNQRSDNEKLMDEVLAEESEAGFRAWLLDDTLRLVRRRRHRRLAQRIGGAAVLLLAAGLALRGNLPKGMRSEIADQPRPAQGFQLVASHPLSPQQLVTTAPLGAGKLVASGRFFSEVETTPGDYQEVGDDELLALAAPQVVALIHRGPHEAELIFVPQLEEGLIEQD